MKTAKETPEMENSAVYRARGPRHCSGCDRGEEQSILHPETKATIASFVNGLMPLSHLNPSPPNKLHTSLLAVPCRAQSCLRFCTHGPPPPKSGLSSQRSQHQHTHTHVRAHTLNYPSIMQDRDKKKYRWQERRQLRPARESVAEAGCLPQAVLHMREGFRLGVFVGSGGPGPAVETNNWTPVKGTGNLKYKKREQQAAASKARLLQHPFPPADVPDDTLSSDCDHLWAVQHLFGVVCGSLSQATVAAAPPTSTPPQFGQLVQLDVTQHLET
ncbi:hypothetical protein TREES_T100017072 [Tupaia chinensis]|uniref:Uncharacterized protein n=1 Tax=Tupaia chinensis TaxID=246437 RepID=L9KUI3_TUPCH|nr:hypothetical protein TREES_T100017072 [Tupaia chinensis]